MLPPENWGLFIFTKDERKKVLNMATKSKENTNTKSVVILSNNRELLIKPTKLKYFTSGDYALYQFFEKHGLEHIIIAPEGKILALRFLSSVFDKAFSSEQVETKLDNGESRYETKYEFDEELEKIYDEELNLDEFKKIISVSKDVNGISEKN